MTLVMKDLPYEIVNNIIEYISQLKNSRWILRAHPATGKMRLQIYPDSQVFAPLRAIRTQMRSPAIVIYDGHALHGLKTIISQTPEITRLFDDEIGAFIGEQLMIRRTELIEIHSSKQFVYITGRYDQNGAYTFLKGTIGRSSSLYAPLDIDDVILSTNGGVPTLIVAPVFNGGWIFNDALQIMEFVMEVDVQDDDDMEIGNEEADFDEPFDELAEFNLMEAFDAQEAAGMDVEEAADFMPFAMEG